MLILGVDPGTATTGWGLVRVEKKRKRAKEEKREKGNKRETKPLAKTNQPLALVDYGCIVTSKDSEMPQRLYLLQKELKKLLQQHKPDVICVEQLFFGANARTAMTVGQARGVVMATAAAVRVPFFEYQGLVVKLAVGGHGRADKKQVERGVKRILGIRKLKKPAAGYMDDAVDAIAIALCHYLKRS